MAKYSFLTVQTALDIHRHVVAAYGGILAEPNHARLESAVGAVRASFAGVPAHEGAAAVAAAYVFHLVKGHPFLDANKRTAFACSRWFLHINGMELRATNAEVVDMAEEVASQDVSERHLAEWFSARIRATPQG